MGRATLSDSRVERDISASSGSSNRRERRKTEGSTLILEIAMPTFVERFPSRKVACNNEITKETNKSRLFLDDRLGLHRFILVWVVNEDILEFGHESIVFLKESERLQRVPVALLQLQMNLSHMLYILFRKLDWMPMNLLSRCFASLSLLLLRLDRPIRFRIIVENLLFT